MAGAGKYFDVFISVTFLASTAPPPPAAAAADNNHPPFTIGHTKHHQPAAAQSARLSSAGIPLCKPLALCNLLSHSRSRLSPAAGSPEMTSAPANVTVSQQQQQVCLSGTQAHKLDRFQPASAESRRRQRLERRLSAPNSASASVYRRHFGLSAGEEFRRFSPTATRMAADADRSR